MGVVSAWYIGGADLTRFLRVRCPRCGAGPGEVCVTVAGPQGRSRPGTRLREPGRPAGWAHLARRTQVYAEEGI